MGQQYGNLVLPVFLIICALWIAAMWFVWAQTMQVVMILVCPAAKKQLTLFAALIEAFHVIGAQPLAPGLARLRVRARGTGRNMREGELKKKDFVVDDDYISGGGPPSSGDFTTDLD